MSTSEPSREVRTFLSRHVRNLDDLQFLMSLIQSGDRWWGTSTWRRGSFGFTLPEARAALERFAALNLMDIRVSGDVRYQFRPGTEELRYAARATVDAYAAGRVRIDLGDRTMIIAAFLQAVSATAAGIGSLFFFRF